MFWSSVLTCLLSIVAGGGAFWLTLYFRVQPQLLLPLGPLVMAVMPPDIAAATVAGAWLAVAFFARGHEGIPVPDEGIGWRKVVRDAAGITVAALVALFYLYRQRGSSVPGVVLALGLLLLAILTLSYFHAMAWDIPRQLRVGHGYAVGFLSFLPWAYILARQGWVVFGLGFLSFMLLPPFMLAAVDLSLALPKFRRRRLRRPTVTIRLPRR